MPGVDLSDEYKLEHRDLEGPDSLNPAQSKQSTYASFLVSC